MTPLIRPDPDHPAGGYAVVSLPAGGGPTGPVTVSIMETFGGRWLAPSAEDASGRIGIGDPNWQPVSHAFGPYPTRRSGDQIDLILGPEIVNKIEGYTRLRLVIGTLDLQTDWPDTLTPLAGARGTGGLQVTRKAATASEAGPQLRQAKIDTVTTAEPEIAPAPRMEPYPVMPGPAVERPRRAGLWGLAVAVVLLAVIGIGLWFWFSTRPDPDPVLAAPAPAIPAPVVPEPAVPSPPAVVTNICTLDHLRALPGGFADLSAAVAACGTSIPPDDILTVVEDAARAGNGEALILFGKFYDADVADTVFETAAGLTLGDNPAQAAEYYSKARDAGAAQGTALLTAVCEKLAAASDTLSKGAHDDYCQS